MSRADTELNSAEKRRLDRQMAKVCKRLVENKYECRVFKNGDVVLVKKTKKETEVTRCEAHNGN